MQSAGQLADTWHSTDGQIVGVSNIFPSAYVGVTSISPDYTLSLHREEISPDIGVWDVAATAKKTTDL